MDAIYRKSFTSINSLYKKSRSAGLDVTLKDVKKFLAQKKTYTLHKQTRKKFKRNKIRVVAINEMWSIDLAAMKNPVVNQGTNWVYSVFFKKCNTYF